MKKLTVLSVLFAALLYSSAWFYQEKNFMKAMEEPDTIKAGEIMRKTMLLPWHNPFGVYCLAAFDFHNKRYLDCIIGLTKLKITYPAFQQSDFLIGESWLYLRNEPRAIAYYLRQGVKAPLFDPSFIRIREIYPVMGERLLND